MAAFVLVHDAPIMSTRFVKLSFILAAIFFTGACSSSTTLPSAAISDLSVAGTAPGVGTSSQYAAFVVRANTAISENVTSLATWSSSNTAVATVSSGLVKGVTAGTITLTVTYQGSTVSESVTVAN